MLRLIVQNGSLSGHQFQLEQKDHASLLIGRGEECAARFDEKSISSRHAMIASDGHSYFLLDQRSINGTFLNGARVGQMRLHSGDVISLGTTGPELQVVIEDAVTAELSEVVPVAVTGRLQPQELSTITTTTEIVQTPTTAKWDIRETAHLVGFFDPEHDSGKAVHSLRVTVMFGICAVLGLMVMGLTILDLGVATTLGVSFVAFVSVTIYLAIFLWLDRYDPEPFKTLAVAFVWGAAPAILISAIANAVAGEVIGDLMTTVVSAPLIEETSKGLGVLLIALLFRRDFDSVVDGIVYAGVVALGFAAVENIEYYGRGFRAHGMEGLAGVYLVRGVLAPFSHVLFTCMTGIGIGVARETHNAVLKWTAPLIGFSCAVFLHSSWNWMAQLGNGVFFRGFFLLEVPLFFAFICAIAYLVHREGQILKKTLVREVERGLITQHHLDIAISVFRRTAWTFIVIGDGRRYRARRQFLNTIAKLGLCHWHKARASEANRDTGSFTLISRLQAEVFTMRDRIE